MASRLVLLFAAAAVAFACLPAPASAVAWMVGDDGGWRARFHQTGWADGKTFRVGDTLSTCAIPGTSDLATRNN